MTHQRVGAPRNHGPAQRSRPECWTPSSGVEVTHPQSIILFGSAARGKMSRHSDVDLLVVADVEDFTPYAAVLRYPGT